MMKIFQNSVPLIPLLFGLKPKKFSQYHKEYNRKKRKIHSSASQVFTESSVLAEIKAKREQKTKYLNSGVQPIRLRKILVCFYKTKRKVEKLLKPQYLLKRISCMKYKNWTRSEYVGMEIKLKNTLICYLCMYIYYFFLFSLLV